MFLFEEELIEASEVLIDSVEAASAAPAGAVSSMIDPLITSFTDVSANLISLISSLIPLLVVIFGGVLAISIGLAVFKKFVFSEDSGSFAAAPAYKYLEDNFEDILEDYGEGEIDSFAWLDDLNEVDE